MRSQIRRWALGVLVPLIATATLAGCGGPQPVAACSMGNPCAPAAYGVSGQCYYMVSPLEVTDPVSGLYAHHLCPSGWTPTLMPFGWHTRYAAFYDSPAYRVYVPR